MPTLKRLFLLACCLMCFCLATVNAQEATPEATPTDASARFTISGSYNVRQPVGDLVRQYTVYVPESYFEAEAPVPLILALHGAGGTGQGMQAFSGLDAIADQEGLLVAYPDAISNAWNDGRGDGVSEINDLGYLEHIIDSVAEKADIDRTRVYATGFSRGAMMAYRLICNYPTQFAGIAAVASTFPTYLISECQNAPPVPVMMVQGTDDPIIPWTGIPRGYLSAMNSLRFWAQHNRCSTAGPIKEAVDLSPLDGTRLLIQTASKCVQPTVLYGVFNGGHTWPGHPIQAGMELGLTSTDFDVAVTMWAFFEPLVVGGE
ncbi:MAG: hypothetical protein LCI00_10315 [Chloroflexi bacterium]|nr:hypothetical protein [Chloroflexota bacterium]MCC6894848.1 hypothetical protein [Anaerolineae bacterium]